VLVTVPALAIPSHADASPHRITSTFKERSAAARIALRKVNAPYRWGAAGPRAFDCSGLVTWSYRRAGHALAGRTSWALHERGARIRRAALRRGDLVYTWDRGLGHVGIFIGRGRYVHAPGSGRRVIVAPVPTGSGFVSAIRP
jgi:cell wall-associated NlpC family hydrolase